MRNTICISIKNCPYFMELLKHIPVPSSTLIEITEYICGNDTVHEMYKVCCPNSRIDDDFEQHVNYHLLPTNSCGPVSVPAESRIMQGGNAVPKEFPWMALIAYREDNSPDIDFQCAGSLINERYVLTAAHCLDRKPVWGVRLGEHDLSLETYESSIQDIRPSKIIIHENYNQYSSFTNDIGLIRLAEAANMRQENIKPICLPTKDLKKSLVGKFLTVTGWGTTDTGHRSMVLNKVDIPVVSLDKCRRRYGKVALISKTQICAGGYQGKDSCSGDSGGPLQDVVSVKRTRKYVVYGIVSYGSTVCGMEGWPAIYTNVREYLTWILDNIED